MSRRHPRPARPGWFLALRLPRYTLAEACFVAANLLPSRVALYSSKLCLRLNPEHRGAAIHRAMTLAADRRLGWEAFEQLLEQLANRQDVSASDLYLTWIPGRLLRRLVSRALWGTIGHTLSETHDQAQLSACRQLARRHFHQTMADGELERAAIALEAQKSLGEAPGLLDWSTAELAWQRDEVEEALAKLGPRVASGQFLSPLDTLRWARRGLTAGQYEMAEGCLTWSRRFVPELAEGWHLAAELRRQQGDRDQALELFERAAALDPQHLETFLARQSLRLDRPLPAAEGDLVVDVPAEITLGASATTECQVVDGGEDWTVFVLPPAARGILPDRQSYPCDARGRAKIHLNALRPHRIQAGPWPLIFIALGPTGYLRREIQVRVPDPNAGRLWVTVTEDHEIHEERGILTPDLLRRLLVEKSRFAADLGIPWTHVVETGSALAMPDHAAASGAPWQALRHAMVEHLAEDVARGNDLQPHLHAFNDPLSEQFPYRLEAEGWKPSLEFLLTSPEQRGPWASACPPPVGGADEAHQTGDRIGSVERCVALLEDIGRRGDPNYRAALWRSGLLDYGGTPADCAWSAVALRRAGLLADSDLPKPRSARQGAVPPAFAAGWQAPFTPTPGGPILQLPIVANVEGDYLMGPRRLTRRAATSVAVLRRNNGELRPGDHLFTLLTHDKFLNARAGRDEFELDPERGDWRTLRRHLEAWQQAGAKPVTARQGIRRVLHDITWQPVPWLEEETFISVDPDRQRIRYRLQILGRGLTASADFPHQVPVPIPPSLRPFLQGIEVRQGGTRLAQPCEPAGSAFWIRLEDLDRPIQCWFDLRQAIGPQATRIEPAVEGWNLTLSASPPFLQARILVPWQGLAEKSATAIHARWQADSEQDGSLHCEPEDEGLLLYPLSFHSANESSAPVSVRVHVRSLPSARPVPIQPPAVASSGNP
ncbi:MAG: tetratricopeptide repeat protein [Acidobacteriota bacterium]